MTLWRKRNVTGIVLHAELKIEVFALYKWQWPIKRYS